MKIDQGLGREGSSYRKIALFRNVVKSSQTISAQRRSAILRQCAQKSTGNWEGTLFSVMSGCNIMGCSTRKKKSTFVIWKWSYVSAVLGRASNYLFPQTQLVHLSHHRQTLSFKILGKAVHGRNRIHATSTTNRFKCIMLCRKRTTGLYTDKYTRFVELQLPPVRRVRS